MCKADPSSTPFTVYQIHFSLYPTKVFFIIVTRPLSFSMYDTNFSTEMGFNTYRPLCTAMALITRTTDQHLVTLTNDLFLVQT